VGLLRDWAFVEAAVRIPALRDVVREALIRAMFTRDDRVLPREIVADLGRTPAVTVKVKDDAEVRKLVEDVTGAWGTVDILVSNAGIMINKAVEEYTEEDWDLTVDTNLKGAFLMAQAVIPLMKAKRSGKIVFMASIAATHAFPNSVPYCASKAGVWMMSKALCAELAKSGINVNSISPGNTATPLNEHLQRDPEFVRLMQSYTPTGRAYLSTDEVAGAAVFLASEDARAIHGVDLIVDDGWCAM